MRGMNDACVDLIYLDRPFNGNRHYETPIGSRASGAAFKNAWTLDDVDVCEHCELADRNAAAYSVIETARQAHDKGMQSYLIMMAVRLLEMRRVLKPTGGIYLDCGPTASHHLKPLMEGIFGRGNFRNEIVWKRKAGRGETQNAAVRFGVTSDSLLFYARSESTRLERQYRPSNPGAPVSATYPTTGRTGTAYMTNRRAGAPVATLTSRSASWTWITYCPAQRAEPITPTTFNYYAPAATAARAAGRWPNGGPYGMTQEEQDRIYDRVVREERGAPTVRMPQGQGR